VFSIHVCAAAACARAALSDAVLVPGDAAACTVEMVGDQGDAGSHYLEFRAAPTFRVVVVTTTHDMMARG
jgi:DNA-binding NarL/FixJ family response regulator